MRTKHLDIQDIIVVGLSIYNVPFSDLGAGLSPPETRWAQ